MAWARSAINYTTNPCHSTCHAMIAGVQHRFSSGFSANFTFTYTRNLMRSGKRFSVLRLEADLCWFNVKWRMARSVSEYNASLGGLGYVA